MTSSATITTQLQQLCRLLEELRQNSEQRTTATSARVIIGRQLRDLAEELRTLTAAGAADNPIKLAARLAAGAELDSILTDCRDLDRLRAQAHLVAAAVKNAQARLERLSQAADSLFGQAHDILAELQRTASTSAACATESVAPCPATTP